MAKIINITDKLTLDKPKLEINGKQYEVNDGMATVMKFEELANDSSTQNMMKAIEITLGPDAVKELNVGNMSVKNFRVLTIAIMAAMQNMDYEEAEARFSRHE